MNQHSLIPYELDLLFSYRLEFDLPPEVIGPVPGGLRVNFSFIGGEFNGPRLHGRIRPNGGDRLIVRPDGVALLDMAGTFETESGALLHAAFPAMMDLGPDGLVALGRGELAPDGTPFRSVPRYETADPDLAWVNRLQCVGIGQVFPSRGEARCDVYAVR
jgi:hypothetical protein